MKLWKELSPYIIIILVVILVRTFIVTPVRVDGASMHPTLEDGQILLLKKYDHSFDRFEIVVLEHENKKLVKRIIGLPNEHIFYLDGQLYINHKKVEDPYAKITKDFSIEDLGYIKIPEGYYLVLGDNRNNSTDSRMIGLIPKERLVGTTSFRLLPLKLFGKVR